MRIITTIALVVLYNAVFSQTIDIDYGLKNVSLYDNGISYHLRIDYQELVRGRWITVAGDITVIESEKDIAIYRGSKRIIFRRKGVICFE